MSLRKLKQIQKIVKNTNKYLNSDDGIYEALNERIISELKYIQNETSYIAHKNIDVKYYTPGEDFFEAVIEKMKKAKKFIFIEFYIIADGKLLKKITNILKEKISLGVEVRILYDDLGSLKLSNKTIKTLKKMDIQITSFNKSKFFIDFFTAYRDHRKIIIIDGIAVFTGGINIADEYVNIVQKFGHWKDCGIEISGSIADDYTVMFLRTWECVAKESQNYEKYLVYYNPLKHNNKNQKITAITKESKVNKQMILNQNIETNNRGAKEIVCAFDDAPINNYIPARNLFSKMINNSRKYIYIQTPYLAIEDSLINDLTRTAKSGVDVRIFVPGIPDKKIVYAVTRSYYSELLSAGVKIYEYTPGFLHSKVILSDDECAFIGSINMDYRSFYKQYECGAYIANSKSLTIIKADFDYLVTASEKVKENTKYPKGLFGKLIFSIIKLFAPLM